MLNTHFEDIILLPALAVTNFPKCTVYQTTAEEENYFYLDITGSGRRWDIKLKGTLNLHKAHIFKSPRGSYR